MILGLVSLQESLPPLLIGNRVAGREQLLTLGTEDGEQFLFIVCLQRRYKGLCPIGRGGELLLLYLAGTG